MRRATLAVLVLGCLALGLGTVLGPNVPQVLTTTVSAQAFPCTGGCSIEPGQKDKAGHHAFCHFDKSGPIVICPSDTAILDPHLDQHVGRDGITNDYCIDSVEELVACQKGEPDPGK